MTGIGFIIGHLRNCISYLYNAISPSYETAGQKNMRRGREQEPIIFNKLIKLGYKVEAQNKIYSMDFTCGGFDAKVTGRVDGVIMQGDSVDTVVEIKNRRHNFYEPCHDLDQLATYVMLTGARRGLLVQQCNGDISIIEYERSEMEKRWHALVAALSENISRL